MARSTIDSAVRSATADRRVTKSEAGELVKAAKKSGSSTPVSDVFRAINGTTASIDVEATRLILEKLKQPLSREEWTALVQKATSPADGWTPKRQGLKRIRLDEVPPSARLQIRLLAPSNPEDEPEVFRLIVAGAPAFLVRQMSDMGPGYYLFDEDGVGVALKEDKENARREVDRIQDAYTSHFGAPGMELWRPGIRNTDTGVVQQFHHFAERLEGSSVSEVMAGDVKRVIGAHKKALGKDAHFELFRHRRSGALLVVAQGRSFTGPKHFATFSPEGKVANRFIIE